MASLKLDSVLFVQQAETVNTVLHLLHLLFSVINMQALAFGVMTSVNIFIMNTRWILGYVRVLVVLL